jgi:membrane protease YdiL (CAAX protease family)
MMRARMSSLKQRPGFAARHPVSSYFALTFAISWAGALAIAAPHLLRGEPVPKFAGLMMFPAMLLGPALTGIFMAFTVDGRSGLRDLLHRVRCLRVPTRWYAMLLIPPALMLCVLLSLAKFVSVAYLPNRFLVGIGFGVIAGFFEEIGWMGYVFPKMLQKANILTSGILLGILWSCWHLPVVDYLGTATPHGAYWFRYFLAFTAAMTAMRVLICWLYANTNSVALSQLMHASSTGALVVLSPAHVSAGQEALWYAVYATGLWVTVLLVELWHRSRSTSLLFASSVPKLQENSRELNNGWIS